MSRAFDGYLNRLKIPDIEVKPSYQSYEETFIPSMLHRWVKMQRCAWPKWLYSGDFEQAVTQWSSEKHVVLLGQMMHYQKSILDSEDEDEISLPKQANTSVALLRMRFGEIIETDMRRRWIESPLGTVDETSRVICSNISVAAAVWTSTHAEYLFINCDDDADSYIASPTLHLIPSEFTDPQLGEFITNVPSVSNCGNGAKRTHLVYQLLHRALNTANRGWVSSSAQLLNLKGAQGAGLRDIITEATLVALTGLHSCIDPTDRVGWRERLLIHHVFRRQLCVTDVATKSPNFMKQVVRRLLLSTYSGNEAARTIHNDRRRTSGAFASAPSSLAPRRCRTTMAAITHAALPNARLEDLEKSSKLIDARKWSGSEEWPWNGKAGANPAPLTLKQVASTEFMKSHVDNFEMYWIMAYRNQNRVSRLDTVQYDVFCEMNDTIKATHNQPNITRLAMKMPYGHRLSLQQSFAIFGKNVTVTNTSYRKELVTTPHYAQMIALARASVYLEQLAVYECSTRIKTRQKLAVYERYVGCADETDEHTIEKSLERLPDHASKLCVCTECHRVVNAHIRRTANNVAQFNVVGLSSCVACAHDCSDVRCAKRTSAAVRTATAAENAASKHALELSGRECNENFDIHLQTPLSHVEAGHLRRDSRRTYEQHRMAKACGENKLLRVSLIGKLVRIYDTWYTLCCYCGALICDVSAHTNVDGLPACMRCSDLKSTKKKKITLAPSDHICRFCHIKKHDMVAYLSPFDCKFDNKDIPPELRVTFWCSKHSPPWLKEALLVGLYDNVDPISMGEILARISDRSTPRV